MNNKPRQPLKGPVQLLKPFACRIWECHDRLPEYLTEESCREVIDSFKKDGQKHPVLARPTNRSDEHSYEVIYGARRLFAAQYLNVPLAAYVRAMGDREAFVEMDIENRVRRDISPYERGISYKQLLRAGHFGSQEELAKELGLSAAQVCRLLKFADLPTAVVTAFSDPRQIRESWAIVLAERCSDERTKHRMLSVARTLQQQKTRPVDCNHIFKALLDSGDKRDHASTRRRDEIIRATDGRPLFRVSYRHNDLHLIIRRPIAPSMVMTRVTKAVQDVLEHAEAGDPTADMEQEQVVLEPPTNGSRHAMGEAGWRDTDPLLRN